MDWILHLDTDELIHPAGAQEYSLRHLLLGVPGNVDTESSIEPDDVKDPFTEVSMFKKTYDHLTKDTYFGMYKESTSGNPKNFLTFGNGKEAARVQDHLCPSGAHRWHNYMKTPKVGAAVAYKGGHQMMLYVEFDRHAFIIASTATEEEMLNWYRERVVWTDNSLNLKLLRKGILTRIYAPAPMTIIQGLREYGLLGSVIAPAQTLLSKTESLQSIENGNSSTAAASALLPARKIDINLESQATAKKTVEIMSFAYHEAAVPPVMDSQLKIEARFSCMNAAAVGDTYTRCIDYCSIICQKYYFGCLKSVLIKFKNDQSNVSMSKEKVAVRRCGLKMGHHFGLLKGLLSAV